MHKLYILSTLMYYRLAENTNTSILTVFGVNTFMTCYRVGAFSVPHFVHVWWYVQGISWQREGEENIRRTPGCLAVSYAGFLERTQHILAIKKNILGSPRLKWLGHHVNSGLVEIRLKTVSTLISSRAQTHRTTTPCISCYFSVHEFHVWIISWFIKF